MQVQQYALPALPSKHSHRSAIFPIILLFDFLYFMGSILGIGLKDSAFLDYYIQSVISLSSSGNYKLLFSVSFISQLFPLTLVFLAGLSAAGVLILPFVFLLKGFAFGCMISAFYAFQSWHGLVTFWCLYWLPEALCLFLMSRLGYSAWGLCKSLAQNCFAGHGAAFHKKTQGLLSGYLFSAIAGLAGGGIQIALCFAFSEILFC